MTDSTAPLVLFVVTEDWYFVSHRAQLVPWLQQAGFRVALASHFTRHREQLEQMGVFCVPIGLRRRRGSWLGEFRSIGELRSVYRRLRPTLIHHVALKPVIFGGLAARGMPTVPTINAIAGMGLLVSWKSVRGRAVRLAATKLLRHVMRGPRRWIIAQNPDDLAALHELRIGTDDHRVLIRGAGVDVGAFANDAGFPSRPTVLYAGRMLRDKGVELLVRAVRQLRARRDVRLVLAGDPDPANPRSLDADQLQRWNMEGAAEWIGRVDDMAPVLRNSTIVCLPTTYGEGIPKILLEAAAAARPMVATDWPGCREIVRDGETGLLVPPDDVAALTAALESLIVDVSRCQTMGLAARSLVGREFALPLIAEQTLGLYRRARAS